MGARPEVDRVAGRRDWMREGQDCVAVSSAAMRVKRVMPPPGAESVMVVTAGAEVLHAVTPAISSDLQGVQGRARSTVVDEAAAINALTTDGSRNATAPCPCAAGRRDRIGRIVRIARTVRTVGLKRSPAASPVPIPPIPSPTISSGDAMPPRLPLRPVAPFTASGAPARCAVHRGSCSS